MQLFTKKNHKLNRLIILALSLLATSQSVAAICDDSYSSGAISLIGDGTSSSTPVMISTPDGLAALATCANIATNTTSGIYYQLASDIDLSAYTNWTPIGDGKVTATTFKGFFDGNNKTISNLTIGDTNSYLGLFGSASDAIIKNISLTNVNISATTPGRKIGALSGLANNSTISNISVSGTIISSGSTFFIGGIVGELTNSSIISSSNSTTINSTGGNSYIGGVIGYAGATTTTSSVSNCSNSGAITGGKYAQIGGIIGRAVATAPSAILVDNSINSGAITSGTDSDVGGIAGFAYTTKITSSSNSGTVNATDNSNIGGILGLQREGSVATSYNVGKIGDNGLTNGYAGGLVGYLDNNSTHSTISLSYNAGLIQAGTGSNVGALYGWADTADTSGKSADTTFSATDSYFDTVASGTVNNSQSATDTAAGGLSTADMTQNASATTMPNFDFTTTWMTFIDDVYHYPQLIAFYTGTTAQNLYSLISTRSISASAPANPVAIPSSGLLTLLALIGLLVTGTSYRFRRK